MYIGRSSWLRSPVRIFVHSLQGGRRPVLRRLVVLILLGQGGLPPPARANFAAPVSDGRAIESLCVSTMPEAVATCGSVLRLKRLLASRVSPTPATIEMAAATMMEAHGALLKQEASCAERPRPGPDCDTT